MALIVARSVETPSPTELKNALTAGCQHHTFPL